MNDSKEHILNTSLNLFLQKSFKEVTMKEIVEKTGLSKGAFYHYFESKEQVFEEVIRHFFSELIITDYTKFSQVSLVDFYNDFLKATSAKLDSSKMIRNTEEKVFMANHYFLIFDALKMLPDFKKQFAKQQIDELNAWTKIIQVALDSGEISSKMTVGQLAKLFVYSGDGVGINYIMEDSKDNFKKKRKEIRALWDSIYSELKV